MTTLAEGRDRIEGWLKGQALPLWAQRGIDSHGRFHERLDFEGRPLTGLPRRTRVQARQVYVFCEAAALGWAEGADVAARGLGRMIADARRDDGLWVATVDDDGRVLDDRPDLYDQAFVLFALAAAHRVLKDARAKPLALETLAAIESQMADPVHGGWQEALPPVLPRRQNPHMHMLEAMLAWSEVDDDPRFKATAEAILSLFRQRFFDAEKDVLGEFFTADWSVCPVDGRIIEPGHHMEWVWLLAEAKRLGVHGAEDQVADRLYRTAMAHGLDANGFALREIDREGGAVDAGRRLWAQTELLRTLVLRGEDEQAGDLIERLFDSHLATATPGLWIDSYDAQVRPVDQTAPASTLYHLMTAFSAVLAT